MKAAATERRDDEEIKSLGSDLLNVDSQVAASLMPDQE
jgi:hypothetical protein